jgi:hypothetical protein
MAATPARKAARRSTSSRRHAPGLCRRWRSEIRARRRWPARGAEPLLGRAHARLNPRCEQDRRAQCVEERHTRPRVRCWRDLARRRLTARRARVGGVGPPSSRPSRLSSRSLCSRTPPAVAWKGSSANRTRSWRPPRHVRLAVPRGRAPLTPLELGSGAWTRWPAPPATSRRRAGGGLSASLQNERPILSPSRLDRPPRMPCRCGIGAQATRCPSSPGGGPGESDA